jgi:hypothetical protein
VALLTAHVRTPTFFEIVSRGAGRWWWVAGGWLQGACGQLFSAGDRIPPMGKWMAEAGDGTEE